MQEDRRHLDEEMIKKIIQETVAETFKKIGLDDENAGKDIVDLRNLIKAWRQAKNIAFIELVKMVIHASIMATGVWFLIKTHFFGMNNGVGN